MESFLKARPISYLQSDRHKKNSEFLTLTLRSNPDLDHVFLKRHFQEGKGIQRNIAADDVNVWEIIAARKGNHQLEDMVVGESGQMPVKDKTTCSIFD